MDYFKNVNVWLSCREMKQTFRSLIEQETKTRSRKGNELAVEAGIP